MTDSSVISRAPLRILIVSAYAHPHVGGVEVVVEQQARTLAAIGHRVTVATSDCAATAARREQVDGYTVIRMPAWNGLEDRLGIAFPLWGPSAAWRIARLIGTADVVHVHDGYHGSSVLAASLARVLRRPLFITQHVGIVEHDKPAVKRMQQIAYRTVGRLLWHWAITVTVYNPIVESFLCEHGVSPEKIRLTCNGVNTNDFRPGDPESARQTRRRYGLEAHVPIVLFVGRLVPKKGFQKLLDARGPEYRVVIVGPGRVPSHVPPQVTFLGPVSRSELRDLYQASDIFAFPAVGEMLTLAMQEAMACGLPVVATAEEAYSRYDLDPSGVTLVAPEPQVLRSAFLEILRSPERRAHMQGYSRHLAEERFDWRKNAEHLAAEYGQARGSLPVPARAGGRARDRDWPELTQPLLPRTDEELAGSTEQ